MCVYEVRKVPSSSIRQPYGEWTVIVEEVLYTFGVVVLVRYYTAAESHGALAVSCKYFKQSKWPFSAAY